MPLLIRSANDEKDSGPKLSCSVVVDPELHLNSTDSLFDHFPNLKVFDCSFNNIYQN